MRTFFLGITLSLFLGLSVVLPLITRAQTQSSDFFEAKPSIEIPIPDLHFADVVVTQTSDEGFNVSRTVDIPYLAQYIASIYKFAVGASAILAIVLMMVGGLEYMANQPKAGIARISNALVGLGLTLGTYIILYAINPDLVAFKALRLDFVERIDYVENISGSLTTGENLLGQSPDAISAEVSGNVPSDSTGGGTGKYAGTVVRAAENVGLNEIANNIAAKMGLNACLWKAQIYMETNWRTGIPGSTCCYGLGAVDATYALPYLKTRIEEIRSIHSQGCPTCPDLSKTDLKDATQKAAARQLSVTWLSNDHEGNLIISAMMRKEVSKGAPNPIATTMAYGMGLGSYNGYLKHNPCVPEKFDESGLIAMLQAGQSPDSLVARSCPVPGQWPVANKNDCPMFSPASGPDSPRPRACCTSVDGVCTRPPPAKNAAGQSIGRKGVCQDGTRKGQTCFAVAGAEEYAKKWLELAQGCL